MNNQQHISTLRAGAERAARIEALNAITEEQRTEYYADYLYEMATDTGFGAPCMWNSNAPRNFAQYLKLRLAKAKG